MSSSDLIWSFSSTIDKDRKSALESVSNFGVVVDRIVAEATITRFSVCRGKASYLKNCYRPHFELKLSVETADLFFNSPNGYRAQYLADPDEGQKQNGRLLGALTDKLLAFASENPAKYQLVESQIRLALLAGSAKIWLTEALFKFDHELIEEVPVPLWRRNALAAIEAYKNGERPQPEQQEKAIWGLRAPRVNSLDVKGGFLNPEWSEVVPYDKLARRFEIHDYGYT
jgi:hypothetical protein